jgi:hypothetical protein
MNLKIGFAFIGLLFILNILNASGFNNCSSNCIISNNVTLNGFNSFSGNSFTLSPNASITISPSQGSMLQINAGSINIEGIINASGSDGINGSAGNWWSEKGGNGGDAGAIILNASFVNVSGSIIANGGNGGKGGDYCPAAGLAQSSSSGGNGGAGGSLVIYYSNLSFEGNLSLNSGAGGAGGLNSTCYPLFARNGSEGKNGDFEEYQSSPLVSQIQPQYSTITAGQNETLTVKKGSGVWSSSNSTIALIINQTYNSAVIEGWKKGVATITITSGGENFAELPLSMNWTSFSSQYEFGALSFSVEGINSTSISLFTNSNNLTQGSVVLNVNDIIQVNGVNVTLEKIINGVAYIILSNTASASQNAVVNVVPGNLNYITINPNSVSMPVNSTQQFNATGFDIAGNIIITNGFYWNTTNNLGFVNQSGFFTSGLTTGFLQVLASIGNVMGTANVTITIGTITFGTLKSLQIQPFNPVAQALSSMQFTATAFDVFNNSMIVNASWSATGNCTISNNTATFTSNGTCLVSASYQNLSNSSLVTIVNQTFYIEGPSTVTAGNGTVQYQAVYCNSTCAIVNANWSGTANGSFNSNAMVGSYFIYAYYNNLSSSFNVTVVPGAPFYISIPSFYLTAGVPQQLYGYAYDAGGNRLNITVNFVVTPINGTAIIGNGLIMGEKAGTILLQGSAGYFKASSISTVYPGAAVSLQINPYNPSIKLYSSVQLNPIAFDSFGNQFTPTVYWNSQLPINGNNLYASKTGSYTITAAFNNLIASTTVSVYQPLNLTGGVGVSGMLVNGIEKNPASAGSSIAQSSSASGLSGFFTALSSSSALAIFAVLILLALILFYRFYTPPNQNANN